MKNTPMNQGVTVEGNAKHTTDNMYSSAPQIAWACKALLEGRTINHATEFIECQGWRLSGIIHVLRHKYGWPIMTDRRGKERIGHYFLPNGLDIGNLELPPSARHFLAGACNDGTQPR
jgi:hypothetical protein